MARKLAAMCQTSLVIRARFRSAFPNESWRIENNPRAPGSVGDMERSSPNNRCQRLTGTRRFGGLISSRSS